MEHCNTCKFAFDEGAPILQCRRYPQQQRVIKTHWCGEFRPARVSAESPFQRQKARKVKQNDKQDY